MNRIFCMRCVAAVVPLFPFYLHVTIQPISLLKTMQSCSFTHTGTTNAEFEAVRAKIEALVPKQPYPAPLSPNLFRSNYTVTHCHLEPGNQDQYHHSLPEEAQAIQTRYQGKLVELTTPRKKMDGYMYFILFRVKQYIRIEWHNSNNCSFGLDIEVSQPWGEEVLRSSRGKLVPAGDIQYRLCNLRGQCIDYSELEKEFVTAIKQSYP